jgi:hypothetical protein
MFEIKTNRKPGDLGIFSDISNDDYHSGEGIGNSQLGILLDNPARLYDKREPTPALQFGSLVDSMIFDPNGNYPKLGILYDKAIKMVSAIKRHDAYKRLLTGGHAQLSAYIKINDVLCRVRPDYVKYFSDSDTLIITDLKTTKSCKPNDLKYSIKQYGYNRQAAFYTDVMKTLTGIRNIIFVNFFVESTLQRKSANMFNHIECLPVSIPEDDKYIGINKGREDYTIAIDRYKHCMDKGFFPGYAYTLNQENNLIVDITQGI